MDPSAPNIPNKPFTLTYNAETQHLSLTWHGKVALEQLREGYTKTLDLIKAQPVSRVLLDLSKRQTDEEQKAKPLFAAIFTELLKVINQPLFVALVVSPEEYFLSEESERFKDMYHVDNQYIITQLFSSAAAAQAWLDNVS